MSAQTFSASDRVLLTPLADGTGVLLHLDTKFYFTLNATGVHVWRSLSAGGPTTVLALAESLSGAFDVEPDAAAVDVAALIDELVGEGLVTA
ncbi:MAG: PqqD family protein [Myxococcales bacterium]|nr:PqqD family protein [Myxococcales bacterium]MCB9520964.1 PqqD family protein [Myxococcales bacterium]MCB9532623.1 PqqD family protein [Myxococcales bacterium]